MNQRTPSFRQHSTGVWFCKWGGRPHYFTLNRDESYELYLKSLEQWARWRAARNARRLPPINECVTIEELAKRFLKTRLAEGGQERFEFYRKHLKRFLAAYSDAIADDYKPAMLQRLKDAMIAQRLGVKTINHDIQAVRTMLQWGMDTELIRPVNIRGVKKLPLGEIPDKSWTPGRVRDFILGCPKPNLRAWLAMQYLCGMRPKEVVRVMTGQGRWVQRGVLAIPNKARQTRVARHVLFSAEAFSWWRVAKPQWSRLDSYSQAVRDALGEGPHRLRHSAGANLMQRGVSREDADSILGHYPRAVSLIYMPMQWRRLRYLAARLTLEDSSRYCLLPKR